MEEGSLPPHLGQSEITSYKSELDTVTETLRASRGQWRVCIHYGYKGIRLCLLERVSTEGNSDGVVLIRPDNHLSTPLRGNNSDSCRDRGPPWQRSSALCFGDPLGVLFVLACALPITLSGCAEY